MSIKLPAYNCSAKCPKCGFDGISVLYCEDILMFDEHLKKTCRACQYSWFEACADSKKLTTKKEPKI